MTLSKKAVTINDIAERAGVSRSTVSRVLNGDPRVDARRREAVEQAMTALQYRPNLAAQGLARGKSHTIGVLTQDVASTFYGEYLKGIEVGLSGSSYHAVFASGNWQVKEEIAALDLLIGRRVDGLIVLGGDIPDEHLQALAEQLPLVIVGRSIRGLEQQCLCVQNFEGAYQATRYLLQRGHTRIAHITGNAGQPDAVERRNGYCRALHDAGVTVDERLIIEGLFNEQSGMLALEMLFARGVLFTAIFASNDQMAYGARLGLHRHHLRVPEDVSIVGFDDQPASTYAIPPLTTVRQPNIEMGAAAAQAVLQLLNGKAPVLPPFAAELIVRESVAQCRHSGFGIP